MTERGLEDNILERAVDALIREHLGKKGLLDSLNTYETEHPKKEDAITTRKELIEVFSLERESRANKARPKPLVSILELLCETMLSIRTPRNVQSHSSAKGISESAATKDQGCEAEREAQLRQFVIKKKKQKAIASVHVGEDEGKGETKRSSSPFLLSDGKKDESSKQKLRFYGGDESDTFKKEDNIASEQEKSSKSGFFLQQHVLPFQKSGRLADNVKNGEGISRPEDKFLSDEGNETDERSRNDIKYRSKQKIQRPTEKRFSSTQGTTLTDSEIKESDLEDFDFSSSVIPPSSSASPSFSSSTSPTFGSSAHSSAFATSSHQLKESESAAAAAMGSSSNSGRPLSSSELCRLQQLIFGDRPRRSFPAAWMQGFFFRPAGGTNSFGLVQREGGPCGILAAVQAQILQLAFHSKDTPTAFSAFGEGEFCGSALSSSSSSSSHSLSSSHFTFTSSEQQALLVRALSIILWRCGECRKASLAFFTSSCPATAGFPRAGCVSLATASSFSGLQRLVEAKLAQLKGDWGVCLFLLSVIFSRGIEKIQQDADFPLPLVDHNDYCTQELVNCMLIGKARGNCFDGVQTVPAPPTSSKREEEELLLHGIEQRSVIGHLSIFEVYQQIEVGFNMKYPVCPVWVVTFESHYSVIFTPFSLPLLDEIHRSKQRDSYTTEFDVYYYDQMRKENTETRITVKLSSHSTMRATKSTKLTPPVELLMKTAFPTAVFDWNGTQPFL
ncbi:putative Protein FAM188B [Monocercomonoides exilis]|uniref:putative Protein FAM188B n=1 Tax=Monocercomonoides exilis TaxID=2049356 RepID=UPI003559E240|nr:putative Protein FAM188B [Monocercomonoides exilis]|eukprot:MONOS_1605.1-p1 / transcript=MONOS_1605.1 / gene=MONOS_1605 / organism=Monocercomonoides_exilis_PA203 / gene_product=UPF0526 protein, putative / transcript_product=UPF0526 protein, putative / location=Mono_scaffold00029:45684-48192(-) / protein_length=730 / sequence_SO=supercontig / SO=protein_coding / is_pseudo=false